MNSDPRFLQCVPAHWSFLRVCYLEYACVGYYGRLLHDAEVAYVFGEPTPSRPGGRVLPGRVIATQSNGDKGWGQWRGDVTDKVAQLKHPSIRNKQHVAWLVHWFSAGTVVDPFMGAGTTALACTELGRAFIGVEIERKYFDFACERIAKTTRQGNLFFRTETRDRQEVLL
jgi:hypothetical protein